MGIRMNKKKIWACIGLAVVALVIIGAVFCVLRPDYVREAVQLLFSNEML
jgi:uncharacterized membrane-anchored protein YhcB (DUF1043 family)